MSDDGVDMVQLDHGLIDVDYFSKPKVMAMMARFGVLSGLFSVQVILTLSKATRARMDVFAAYGLGAQFGISIDEAKAIVAYCVKEEMLSLEGDILSQERVARDQKKCAAERARRTKAQQGYRNRGSSQSKTNVTDHVTDHVTAYVTDHITDPEIVVGSSFPDTDTDTDLNNLKETVSQVSDEPEVTAPEGTPEWFRQIAESELEKPANQPWTKTNAFVVAGRRPLKRYPNVLVSAPELAQVLELYVSQGIPLHLRKIAFQRADAAVLTKRSLGERVDSINPFNWLMGYLYTDTQQAWKEELRVQQAGGGAR